MLTIYLIALLIAPQLWLEPFIGIRVDFFIYPIWILILALKGQLNDFFDFKSLDYFILAYIVWIILSSLLNESNPYTTKAIIDYIKWFVLFRLVYITVKDVDGVRKAASTLVFIVFIIVIEGIMHKHNPAGIGWAGQPLGWVDPSVLAQGGTGRTQWINIFDGPGVFCVMYTLALPFLIRFFDKHYSFSKKIVALVAVFFLLLAIWYTGSRGGFLATLGIIGGYLLFRNAHRLKLSLGKMLLICTLLLGILALAPDEMTQVKDSQNSAQHRVDMWLQGLEMVRQNPLFGIGRGNFASYTGRLIAHNSAVENMGELGLPGLFLWAGIFYMALKYLFVFSTTTTDTEHSSLSQALLLCLIGYLISSLFVTLEYETMYFILGLAAVFGKQAAHPIEFTKGDFINIAMLVMGWVLFLRVFTSLYY